MSYQVLARKWRPRFFSEMVGQEHVLRALINALDHDRLHHAFLFTGTRGVGKTTIARILAKSLNCEKGVSSTPCGECSSCCEIDEGRFMDLIEVDAASRTKVEDTRELLDNVQYAPTRGRYKVYLIDEVHMLSTHSFNALLKTLEEPPPHIKFLLATTDPQRLPVTVLSRCLQFNLKRLPQELISKHLMFILKQEAIEFEDSAIKHIARVAEGSMRDALSLLDQAIAYGGGKLLESEVRTMLGTIEQCYVLDLLKALASGDGEAMLKRIQLLSEQVPDFSDVLGDIITTLHRIALAQVVPAVLDNSIDDYDDILQLSKQISPEDTQLYYQIGINGQRDLELAPDPRCGFEMLLLRMLAFRPVAVAKMSKRVLKSDPAHKETTEVINQNSTGRKVESQSTVESAPSAVTDTKMANWATTVDALKITGMVRELAVNCLVHTQTESVLHLTLDTAHTHLQNKNCEKRLEKALQKYYSKTLKLRITTGVLAEDTPAVENQRDTNERQQVAEKLIEEDANIKAFQQSFNARVLPNSVQPVD